MPQRGSGGAVDASRSPPDEAALLPYSHHHVKMMAKADEFCSAEKGGPQEKETPQRQNAQKWPNELKKCRSCILDGILRDTLRSGMPLQHGSGPVWEPEPALYHQGCHYLA